MYSNSPYRTFEDDPYFRSHMETMQYMQQAMLNPMARLTPMMTPQVMLPSPYGLAPTAAADPRIPRTSVAQAVAQAQSDPYRLHAVQAQVQAAQAAQAAAVARSVPGMPLAASASSMMPLMAYPGVGDMFSGMNSLMSQMQAQPHHNGSYYSHSSVMSYSSNGQGPPKIYQASSSMLEAPGGVRETHKAVRDSEQGIEKVAVGHHIGERAHLIERQRDTTSGDQEENQDFVNLDTEEADTFNREFEDKIRGFRPVHRNHGHRQITDGRSRYEGSMPSVSRPRYISHVQPTSQLAISHAPPPLAPQLQPRAHIPSSKPASQSSMPYGK